MKTDHSRTLAGGALAALVLAAIPAARAQLSVDALVEPLGGSFRYDFTVNNPGPDDFLLVTIYNAPLGDALMTSTLAAPAGFMAGYDDGLGLVDFVEDSLSFTAGTSAGFFSFESLSGPSSFFDVFVALDPLGREFTGNVNVRIVPEAGTVVAGAALGSLALVAFRRRFVVR
ncbi:MAG: hypothetical protein ACKVYV_12685 [Limisphaerales bacterium]